MNISLDVNIWIAGFLTLTVFSFLYRDNPFYKFAEALFIGVSAGYIFCISFFDILQPKLFGNLAEGAFVYLIPLFLGFLMLAGTSEKLRWLTQYPLAFFIGTYAGINLLYYAQTYILDQAVASITKPFDRDRLLEIVNATLK